ncbi:MAG: DUF454 domain-containing protein [Deltaproteobacteria bacterium]|nr:MAG: DUF454 domain-containing protein [Deltaproteobacteria bacterium]
MSSRQAGRIRRSLLIAAGILSTLLAILGIFLPLLPTVPLLLLAAACFARSSPRHHAWLREHRHLGPLLAACQGGAIPRRARRKALMLIWISIPVSILLLAEAVWLQVLLLLIAIAVTIYLLRLPTAPPDPE